MMTGHRTRTEGNDVHRTTTRPIPHMIDHNRRTDPASHRAGTPAQTTADAAAHPHAQARIETLDSYLGSLTEHDRAEYIAASARPPRCDERDRHRGLPRLLPR